MRLMGEKPWSSTRPTSPHLATLTYEYLSRYILYGSGIGIMDPNILDSPPYPYP